MVAQMDGFAWICRTGIIPCIPIGCSATDSAPVSGAGILGSSPTGRRIGRAAYCPFMRGFSACMADQCIRDPQKTTDELGRSRDIKLLCLVIVIAFFFLTTVVLSTLLLLERRRSRVVARVQTREVGSQAPTTYTHKSAQPRFKPLPDFSHG